MEKLDPRFDQIGQSFLQYYYAQFDSLAFKSPENVTAQSNLMSLYHELAMLTFEGLQAQGQRPILAKFTSLPFKTICRSITTVDCQPVADGGVLVMVVGKLKTDDDPPHTFDQTFLLRPQGQGYVICHDMFRLSLHND